MIDWTRIRLKQWGRWCQGGVTPSLPTMAAFERANSGGRGVYHGQDMPLHIQMVETAVAKIGQEDKQVLVAVYCRNGPLLLKAARAGMSIQSMRTRLKRAERAVAIEIYGEDACAPNKPVVFSSYSKITVTAATA